MRRRGNQRPKTPQQPTCTVPARPQAPQTPQGRTLMGEGGTTNLRDPGEGALGYTTRTIRTYKSRNPRFARTGATISKDIPSATRGHRTIAFVLPGTPMHSAP